MDSSRHGDSERVVKKRKISGKGREGGGKDEEHGKGRTINNQEETGNEMTQEEQVC